MRVGLLNDTSGRHFGCDLVLDRIRTELRKGGAEISWTLNTGVDWSESATELEQKNLDAFVVNGEGSIHNSASRPRAKFLPAFGRFSKTALKKPAYLINSTIYNIDQQAADDISFYDGVFVRDSDSEKLLQGFGVPSTVVADLTLTEEIENRREGERRGVLVTDSVVKSVREALRFYALRNLLRYEPIHYGNRNRLMGLLARRPNSASEYAALLSRYKLVITGRFHVVTLCLATGTPVVAIESNTPKISSLLKDVLGAADRLIPASGLRSLDVNEFGAWSSSEEAAISKTRAETKRSASAMFSEILSAASAIA